MIRETVQALVACIVTFVVCVVAYPAVVWGLGQVFFPHQAEGSLIYGRDRTVIGSELIAQPFAADGYFHPRPSAAGPNGYAADAASGSNLATKNPALRQRITLDASRSVQQHTGDAGLKKLLESLDAQQAELKAKNEIKEKTKADTEAIAKLEGEVAATQEQVVASALKLGENPENLVPADLVTTSGGGLDPHISPEGAQYQVSRVAAARKMPVRQVRALIERFTEHTGVIIGAPPCVNVLQLNRALDEEKPVPEMAAAEAANPAISELSSDFAALRTQITAIAGQIEQLGKQIETARDDKTAAGLKDLEARVATLSESLAGTATLSDQVGKIGERVNSAGETLQQLRSQLDETRASLKQRGPSRPQSGSRP